VYRPPQRPPVSRPACPRADQGSMASHRCSRGLRQPLFRANLLISGPSSPRQAYKLRVKEGRLYDAGGNPFDTGDEIALYVMDQQGQIFAARTSVHDSLHHSSLLAGEPVAGAGIMQVRQGRVMLINDRSGHYHPPAELFQQVLRRLSGQGVFLP
jgi:hypothetical protein